MYASIRRHSRTARPPDEAASADRRLAADLSKVPGFVAYALLEISDRLLVSVSIFEGMADLTDADQLAARWELAQPAGPECGAPQVITGEVIVQKGL